MNLTALRQKVKNITDYSPELQQFNDQIDELLNDAFNSIWVMRNWNFATKTSIIDFHIDITKSTDTEFSSGADVTVAVVNGDRRITFSANIGRFNDTNVWEGSPISLNGNEYTISKIIALNQILLTEAFYGDSNAGLTNWTIKKRYYTLPEDCAELLYFGHRDYPYNTVTGATSPYGKATAILPRRDEVFGLRADWTANFAEAYIPSPTIPIKAAETMLLTSGDGAVNVGTYELCWAFVKDGKTGSLSEPKTITVTSSSSINVFFTGWDGSSLYADTYFSNDQVATQWEGWRKIVFWNKNFDRTSGERLGLPCWLAVTKGGSTRNVSTYLEPLLGQDTSLSVAITSYTQFDNGSKRYIEIDGQHQRIRPYPRVIGYDEKVVKTGEFTRYTKQAVLRYKRKPTSMLLATDSPELPAQFHQLIVYKALEDIYLKFGNQGMAATYERKYSKEVKRLEKTKVDGIDYLPQRSQFQLGGGRSNFDASQLSWLG